LQAKSLKIFNEKFSPKIAIRSSMVDYKNTEGLIDLPLYAINAISSAKMKGFW
jgi:hypothetical protein